MLVKLQTIDEPSKSQVGHFSIGGRIRRRRKKRWRNETDKLWRTAGSSRKDQLK